LLKEVESANATNVNQRVYILLNRLLNDQRALTSSCCTCGIARLKFAEGEVDGSEDCELDAGDPISV